MDYQGKFNKLLKFEGLVAPPVAPMQQDGSINYDAIPSYVGHLVRTGVNGVYISGTTGEFPSLTLDERKMLTEVWIKHGKGKLDLIMIHCGSSSISEAKELVRHAEQLGADGIACIAPSFLKAKDEDALSDYLQELALEAPKTPFFFYHLPSMSNVFVDMEKLMTKCCDKIETFAGLKCSTSDLLQMVIPLKFKRKHLKVFYGFDWQFLGGLAMGSNSAVCTAFNFLGRQFSDIIKAYKEGNMENAQNIQHKVALDISPFFAKYHGVAFAKVATRLVSGIDMGPARRPMHQFTQKELDEIQQFMAEKGYIEGRE